jgi:hypothetical protein
MTAATPLPLTFRDRMTSPPVSFLRHDATDRNQPICRVGTAQPCRGFIDAWKPFQNLFLPQFVILSEAKNLFFPITYTIR